MRKFNFLAFMALVSVVLFTACTSDHLEAALSQSPTDSKSFDNAITFGTYMRTAGTRAGSGAEGDITLGVLQNNDYSFGVFGVYSAGTLYNSMVNRTPNFMYNEKVYWSSSNWKYDILKYWPNGTSGASGDADDEGATSSTTNYLNFFAYAPYVDAPVPTSPAPDYGIMSISASNAVNNPIIGYKLDPTLSHFVDFLWGTIGATDPTVTGTAQASGGVTTTTNGTNITTGLTNNGNVNIDLTKQKVGGQVKFNFKHTLARLGGPAVNSAAANASGFRVKLDIDNGGWAPSSATTGGTREKFTVSTTNDAWRTKVTIKEIAITNDLNASGTIDGSEVGIYEDGTFDLARGVWTPGSGVVMNKLIATESETPAVAPNAELNSKLAEYYSNSGTQETWISKAAYATKNVYFKTSEDTDHPGVTEAFQNVYNSATASPLVLIPGTTPKFKVTVTYVVRTYDDKLSNEYTEVEQTISKEITFTSPIEINKRYNIDMSLGLTTVKFDATVASWDEGNFVDTDTDGTPDSNVIYLPINVD